MKGTMNLSSVQRTGLAIDNAGFLRTALGRETVFLIFGMPHIVADGSYAHAPKLLTAFGL
jgi:hypothetical protein